MSFIIRRALMTSEQLHEVEAAKKGSYDWKKEHLTQDQMSRTKNNSARFSGIPAIPTDIGFNNEGKNVMGKKKSGFFSRALNNSGVILGMAFTTIALLGMFKRSFSGDKLGTQKFMQYRVMAQFFTITTLVAGVTIFASTSGVKGKQQKQ